MPASRIHEEKFVVSRLPHRVFEVLRLTLGSDDHVIVGRTSNVGRVPTFDLDNKQPDARDDHDEIRVPVGDHGFVVDDHIIRQVLKKREDPLFACAGTAWKAIGYHFGHVLPRLGRCRAS